MHRPNRLLSLYSIWQFMLRRKNETNVLRIIETHVTSKNFPAVGREAAALSVTDRHRRNSFQSLEEALQELSL